MADRIRWSDDTSLGVTIGCVGTLDPLVFTIAAPRRDGDEWLLMSRLTGQESVTAYGDSLEALKLRAEELLAAFVASLGAVFPDEPERTEGAAQ